MKRGGSLHLAGVAMVHEHHVLELRVGVLAAELASETARAERLERELLQTKRTLAICQIERLLEGYVDCDRAAAT